jgi:hypothetical protein
MRKRKCIEGTSPGNIVDETREMFIQQLYNSKWWDRANLKSHLKDEIVTKEDAHERIESFQKHTDSQMETLICASCGIEESFSKDFIPSEKYRQKKNFWEKCSTDSIPNCFISEISNPNLFVQDNKAYNLYSVLVSEEGSFNLCPDCSKFKVSGKPTIGSISGGLLFDVVSDLCELSFMETLLLTKYHPYLHTVKIKKPENAQFNSLKGHVICYEHDGLQITNDYLFTDIEKVLTVTFVGPANEFEDIKKNLVNMEIFRMDPSKLLQWLVYLKSNNDYYAHAIIPSVQDLKTILKDLERRVLNMISNVEITQEERTMTAQLNEETYETLNTTSSFSLLVQPSNNNDMSATSMFTTLENCLKVTSTKDPINEYNNLDEILYLAFPTIFTYGKGLTSKLNKSLVRKWMLFFDNRFSRNCEIQFYLYSVLTRMKINHQSAIYVKANPDSVQEISELVNDPFVFQKLASSIENPRSDIAKSLLEKLLKHCTVPGSTIPFSDFEKQFSLVELIAYIRVFGLPTYFVTVSPNQSNLSNVVDSTEKFFHNLQYLFKDLVGIVPEHLSRTSQPSIEFRNKGIFGTPVAFYSVVESQARGSLHIHFLLWSSIPSWLFSFVIGKGELESLVAQVIDSTVSAHVPDVHLLNYYNRKTQSTSILESTDTYDLVTTLNTHRHSFTCRKGKNGLSHCRMAFARPTQPRTAPIEIVQDENSKFIGVPLLNEDSVEPFSLFSNAMTRPITWQLKRPSTDLNLEIDGYPISNSYITEFNINLTKAVQSNTCVSFLGDTLGAKTACYYLCK